MKRWKKRMLLAGSLFLLLLPKKIVNACGFYVSPGEYRFWLLQPDLTNQPDLTPFFFASTYLYRQDAHPVPDPSVRKNIAEWYQHIQRAAPETDIDSLLNNTDPQAFFDQGEKIARRNLFLRYLLRPENKDLYDYVVISKKVEQIAADPDPWEENRFPAAAINKVIEEAAFLQKRSHSLFIRFRTAFQLIRLYGYNRQPALINKEYNAHISPVETDSWIKTAALYQKALNGNPSEYEYLLSKVFDRGGYNRSSCLIKFRRSNYYHALQHARNAHERTVLYTMQVLNHPGRCLPYIRTIYQTEPGYKEIPFLLLREINKVEDWLVTNQVTDFSPAVYHGSYWWNTYGRENYNKAVNYQADKAYANSLRELIESIIREKKSTHIALLHLFAAHLSMLNGEYVVARHHLDWAKKEKKQPANVRFQIKINSFLLDLQTAKSFDLPGEQNFMSILQTPALESGVYDHELMKDQLILYTARKLVTKGARAKGYLLLGKTRRAIGELPIGYKGVYQELEEKATPDDYDGMISILDKTNKTPFEKFVTASWLRSPSEYNFCCDSTESIKWNKYKLLDCKSTWYIRNNNLKAALSTLEQIPGPFWKQEPYRTYIKGDPFFLNVYSAHRITAADKQSYNKRQLVAKMVSLQQLSLQGGSKAAQADFLLANAWYNISYYGKDWLVMKQWWSINELSTYNSDLQRNSFQDIYMGCAQAKELYLKALQKTTDKKLATLCCFMAGICNNHFREYLWTVKNRGNDNASDFKPFPNPYRASLEQKGVDERYYREIVLECAAYNDCIRAYNE